MPLGQAWLNAWIKVNSKHVVFPPTQNERESQKDDNKQRHVERKNSQKGADSSVKTDPTVGSEHAEAQAVRRFNSRKHRRRLHRAVSASDLIREQVKMDNKGDNPDFLDRSFSTHTISNTRTDGTSDEQPEVTRVAQHEERSIISNETEGSLRFVAGFFGTELAEAEAAKAFGGQARSLQRDAASVHQIGSHSHIDAASIASRGGESLPTRPPLSRNESQDNNSKGVIGIRFPPNLFSGDNGNCRQCTKLEAQLTSSREDLEYLRSIALQSEYICATCQLEPSKRTDSDTKNGPTQQEGSELMNEASQKHRDQIEKLTSERMDWQHDAQVKLQGFGNLCRQLDEEAAIRNDEAIELHNELESVRQDRDKVSAELEEARAKIAQYERKERERPRLESLMKRLEEKGLDGVDRAIKTRDRIILDLSARLERALSCLESEREQQRQRRQIIFPSQRSSSGGDGRGDDLEAEVKSVKESLRESQEEVQMLQHQMKKKEQEWMIRLENLERQLETARSTQGL